jgi:protein-S-isoprenylcysteine O-methyltransferase Ste14
MKIGAAALAAVLLIIVGLFLYSVTDLKWGGWLALTGVFLAFGATLAAYAWPWTHDDDFR